MRTTHGLWRMHRYLRRGAAGIRWWADDEAEAAFRRAADYARRSRNNYPENQIITRCATRFARRFGTVHTVDDYNALVARIAERMGANHRAVDAAMLSEAAHRRGGKAAVRLRRAAYFEDGVNVEHRFTDLRVMDRLTRMVDARRMRTLAIDAATYPRHDKWLTCSACHHTRRTVGSQWANAPLRIYYLERYVAKKSMKPLARSREGDGPICIGCYARLSAVADRLEQVAEIKNLISGIRKALKHEKAN